MEESEFLGVYDRCLRTDAETPSAIAVTRLGPLRLVRFAGGRGFVTYPPPRPDQADTFAGLVAPALEHYRRDPSIGRVEWKTRGHDHIPGLPAALLENGFEADETESIMIGRAQLLDLPVELPAGVTLRTITREADVAAMTAMEDLAFESDVADAVTASLLQRLSVDDGIELWVAEARGRVIGAGRLEPVAGTPVAGIWGGAVLPAWRGRGVYRALTAARVHAALSKGKTLIHSDSNENSRPILERAGLISISTTTPYHWKR